VGGLSAAFARLCLYLRVPVTSTLSHRHVLLVGFPSGDMHDRYGTWPLVYARFWRWRGQGVWETMVQTLLDLELTAPWQPIIDTTTTRYATPHCPSRASSSSSPSADA